MGIKEVLGLQKTRNTEAQKNLRNRRIKKVMSKAHLPQRNPAKLRGNKILIFDSIVDSRYTIKEIGEYLAGLGCGIDGADYDCKNNRK